MFRLPRRRTLFVMLALAACASFAAGALASHTWGNYHWARTSNPFTLKIGNNVTSNWTQHFTTSVADWHRSSVMGLQAVAGTSNKR